jgi:hypothetical protein
MVILRRYLRASGPKAVWVDGVAGSDLNDGLSITTPVKTLGQATTVHLATSRVLIRIKANGARFREQLGGVGAYGTAMLSGVRVETYDTGALPVLDGSDDVSASAFTQDMGYTNVWYCDFTPEHDASAVPSPSAQIMLLTDNYCRFRKDLATLDAGAEGDYYCAQVDSLGTYRVYFWSDVDPNADGKTREISSRMYCCVLPAGGSVDGVITRCSMHNNGSLYGQHNSNVVSNCIAQWGHKHNMICAGQTINCKCWWFIFIREPCAVFTGYLGVATGLSLSVDGLEVIQHSRHVCTDFVAAGVIKLTACLVHTNVTDWWQSVTIRDLWVCCCGSGIGVNGVAASGSLTIEDIVLDEVNGGINVSTLYTGLDANIAIRRMWAKAQDPLATKPRLIDIHSSINHNVEIEDNILICSDTASSGGTIYCGQCTYEIEHNTIVAPAPMVNANTCIDDDTTNTIVSMTQRFNNFNAWDPTKQGSFSTFHQAPVALTSDHNLFEAASYDSRLAPTSYASVALWQAGTGKDANSVIGAPVYEAEVDPSYPIYKLSAVSPGKAACPDGSDMGCREQAAIEANLTSYKAAAAAALAAE